MGFEFVERRFYLPALVIEGRQLAGFYETAGIVKVFVFVFAFSFSLVAFLFLLLLLSLLLPFLL
jgi:hypothetical protein